MKILLLNGTIKGKKTRVLLDLMADMLAAKAPEAEIELADLRDYVLQFSDGRNYQDYTGDTLTIAQKVMAADVLVLGSPIYQASIPAPLKNVLDLLPKAALRDKTVAIIMTSGSGKHYLVAEMQLKPILTFMKANIMSSYVFAEDLDFIQDELNNDDIRFRLQSLAEDTITMAQVYQQIRQSRDEQEYDF